MKQAEGVKFTRILSIGAARGSRLVPNADVIEPIDSSDEWIRQRTGIESRRYADDETDAIDLAVDAAREAIEGSGLSTSDIDGVIVASISNPRQTPSMSAVLAGRLGLETPASFDVNAACAGYCYGIAQADALIRAGQARNVLVVGAEKLSELIDPTDRSISFLLGDGAGAAVVGPSDEAGISKTVWGSDGAKSDLIKMNEPIQRFRRGEVEWPTLRQEGPSVYRWAVQTVAQYAEQILEEAGVAAEEIDAFIPHQANKRIIDTLAKHLEFREDVVVAADIVTNGNTSAASIPLATHALLREHPELSGKLALQIGFGAGLVWAGQVVRLP